jgi:hypothetical protein
MDIVQVLLNPGVSTREDIKHGQEENINRKKIMTNLHLGQVTEWYAKGYI